MQATIPVRTTQRSFPSSFTGRVYMGMCWVTAAIFLYSASSKIINIYGFGLILDSYGLIPEAWNKPLSILIPIMELLISAGMLYFPFAALAAGGAGLLVAAFTTVLLWKWGEVLPYGCGCFGPGTAREVGYWDITKNACLLIVVGYLLIYRLLFWRRFRIKSG
ncbi:MauE/DoxX family redox-associated membrane protein [Paenibacillus sedimenti]|uniref:Methylamine utilisation protein MauE domain-containing protein n=1 Tax=Paenibacillus sedimenti TaxID=2770274 RepID=A0A926KNR7_9BACL|nr:MauE/DoxX family redox-associated membrane protein [Paenibacillus sedimenti]MBD0379613.1 hypothetical protein [Paenibacillus sedimenti]